MYNIDRIRSENDLVQIAEHAGAIFKKSNGEWRSHCPIHNGDNKNAFAVYTVGSEQHYKCFTREECGTGDVIDFVQKKYGYSFNQACEWLGGEQIQDPIQVARLAEERARRNIEELEAATNKALGVLKELRETETWLQYHLSLEENKAAQKIWEQNGIPVDWQNYWQLGYCNNFTIMTDAGKWTSPTLTIPIFSGENWDLQNIKHRLLNPYKPGDKYRPEKPGLTATPFYCNPEMMLEANQILIVEGEKKAMVTYLTIEDSSIQIIGLPGKNQWRSLLNKFASQSIYILLDPDAIDQAREFSKLVNGRIISLAMKVDDAIIDGALDKNGIRRLLAGARRN